jgi:hypothetical protein
MRFSLRLYRLLLKLYPAGFRENYHAPMQQQFREQLGEIAGPRALARFWTLGGLTGLAMAVGFGRYLQSLVRAADSAIVASFIFAVLVTAVVAAAATWSATRHVARLDIGDVLRGECAD